MSATDIARELQAQVSESIYVEEAGNGRHYVATPFVFGDGDQPVVALVANGRDWELSDLGNTLFRLGFQLSDDELSASSNQRQLESALSMCGVVRRDGALTKPLRNGNYADSLFNFIHAMLKIDELGDFSSLSSGHPSMPDASELARPAGGSGRPNFKSEVAGFVEELLPEQRINRDWYDHSWDFEREYQVDFRINGATSPMFLHAISTATQARDATITIYRFLDQDVDGRHVSVFRDASRIGKRVLSKLEVVCQESFRNLGRDRTTIKDFLLNEAGMLNEPRDLQC